MNGSSFPTRTVGADRIRPQHKAPLRGACAGAAISRPLQGAYAFNRVLAEIRGYGRLLAAPYRADTLIRVLAKNRGCRRILSAPTTTAAEPPTGRLIVDPYQAQKLLACSNQRDTTYSPFTLTYYLRPRRWAMPARLGHLCIGTRLVASLSAAQPSPTLPRFLRRIVTGRVREPTY